MGEALAAPAFRSLRLPELLPVLCCPATSSSTTPQLLEALGQGGGWVAGIMRFAELVGVAVEVVQLPLSARVLHVLATVARADTSVGRGVVGCSFEQDGAPPGGAVPLEHRLQGASINVFGRVHAGQGGEGGQVVGVEDQLVGLTVRRHAGAAHQQRHADVLLVRAPFFLRYAVLACMPSVVGGEEYVGV